MAWGLFPIFYASYGIGLEKIGWLAALYPAVWGLSQLVTGPLSDKWGRKGLIVAGMWMQASGIATTLLSTGFWGFAVGSILLGLGTAMVYPTLLAAISDVASHSWRASSVGVYRLWRDSGYGVWSNSFRHHRRPFWKLCCHRSDCFYHFFVWSLSIRTYD